MYIVSGIVFILFGSGRIQYWNENNEKDKVVRQTFSVCFKRDTIQ